MVDNLDQMVIETSDLSLFCFYSKFFEDNFQMCLEFPAQNRFIIAFPLICGHFSNITTVCDEQCTLSDRLLPKHCAPMIAQVVNKKKREKTPKKIEFEKPGFESYRKTREDLTTMDKLHMALTELCFAINYCVTISVWEYTFAPREYL